MNDTTTRTAPKAAVILTPAAEQRVAALMAKAPADAIGVKLSRGMQSPLPSSRRCRRPSRAAHGGHCTQERSVRVAGKSRPWARRSVFELAVGSGGV